MVLRRVTSGNWRKDCTNATLSTTNPTLIGCIIIYRSSLYELHVDVGVGVGVGVGLTCRWCLTL